MFKKITDFPKLNLILSFGLSFFIFLKPVLDPDLGWHLRMGKWIVHNKAVPWTNLFSYTLPNYQWVDSYWLTQILMYLGKTGLGLFPLAVIFAFIATAAVYLVSKGNPLLMILVAVALRGSSGVRPMTISFLFLAVETIILRLGIRSYSTSHKGRSRPTPTGLNANKYLFLLIPLFALWANMHADWVIGLFVLGLYLGIIPFIRLLFLRTSHSGLRAGIFGRQILNQILNQVQNDTVLSLFILFASIAATLLNPYTYHLWTTLFKEVGATAMHRNINEWLVPTLQHPAGFLSISVITLVVFLIFWRITKKNLKLKERFFNFLNVLPQFIFAVLAMKSYYYLHILILISAPFILESFKLLGRELELKKLPFLAPNADFVFQRFFLIGLIFTALAVSPVVVTETWRSVQSGVLADRNTYPVGAVNYIKEYGMEGRMYNHYGWGGYLIYHLPEKKTFIDGRMPAWRKEGEYIFKEYLKAEKLQSGWEGVFRRYNIDWAILKNNSQLSFKLQKELGWLFVYTDETAVILHSSK